MKKGRRGGRVGVEREWDREKKKVGRVKDEGSTIMYVWQESLVHRKCPSHRITAL